MRSPLGADAAGDGGPPRWLSAAAAAALQLLLAVALVVGFAPPRGFEPLRLDSITAIAFRRPAPILPPPASVRHRPAGASAPSASPARAAPVFAAANPLIEPPPIAAATRVADAAQAHSGADLPGNGTGAGGAGSGTGSGDVGAGDGGGDGAELTHGRIKDSDYPSAAREAQIQGTTQTRISVSADGRPTACRILRSSGSTELDDTTCRLAMQRFRFRPARDAAGHAAADSIDYDQEWTLSGRW